jgi:hypothetical protein
MGHIINMISRQAHIAKLVPSADSGWDTLRPYSIFLRSKNREDTARLFSVSTPTSNRLIHLKEWQQQQVNLLQVPRPLHEQPTAKA